ncbi:ribonuclease H-like YkuK family protein [Candidatus Gottesmanbacteria bacterium]|nr:ribonuclease H-like YkuK family protein [Candidatus Gottesmanbacteria bacterium]MBI5465399.1 ribonuclease H-like YkuK family protein [Candidatus Gottesmanbacteria bacterium]
MIKIFNSPTFGTLTLEKVREKVLGFMSKEPEAKYHLVIGTDSQSKNGNETDFVTALVVHRVGRGGIYFWRRKIEKKTYVLRARIYQEAALSLALADEFLEATKHDGISRFDVEIHVDIGEYGETREMINEVVGMIRGQGFLVQIKPEAYGASKVADRHT